MSRGILGTKFLLLEKIVVMANRQNPRDNRNLGSDRRRVAGGQEHEVRYLAEQLDCSTEDVENAIREVGNSRLKIQQYIKNKKR